MNRTHVRSLIISSVAVLPLLAGTAWAEPINPTLSDSVDAIPAEMVVEPEAPKPVARTYTASLKDATRDRAERTLDWRNPQAELRFDLSHADTIDALSVTLSADPLAGVDPSIPLILQFNGGKSIEIPTNGQGFDSIIDLDRTRVRETGNVLRLSYATSCDAPTGGYRLNLTESRLKVSAFPRARQLQLREVEKRFASLTFAPETIGLLAGGAEQTKLQALAAQGIGLRMAQIPDFRLSAGESDFDLIMVTRNQLVDYTDDAAILSGTGPSITLSKTEPNRLFLTGDTPEDVMASVKAFASAFLPNSRRSETTPTEVLAQSPLDVDRRLIVEKATLDLLTVQTGTHREYTFDVADPAASEGHLLLRLNRDGQTQKGTRLMATLNGVDLGEAKVRGKHKTVDYPIEKGLLLGTSNRLELTTQDANNHPRCGASVPFIAIAEGSELRLSTEFPTPPSDLSRFAANGSLFSTAAGAQTVMILPERDQDFTTSLTVVAKLAQASGRGWVEAAFNRGETDVENRHTLIIEPYSQIERAFRLTAPRGIQSAWRGHGTGGGQFETIEQFASLNGEDVVRQASANIRTTGLVQAGGVAAIYPDDAGYLIGIISNTADSSFATAMRPLLTDMHWNGLKGAVTRWNDSAVIMAQAAIPMPVLGLPIEAPKSMSLTERAKGMAAQMSEIEWPRPNVDGLGGWIDTNWTSFSDTVRSKTETFEMTRIEGAVEGVVQTVVAGSIEKTQSALNSQRATDVKHAARGLQGQLDAVDAKTADLRTAFWKHLDIPTQDMKSARLGQAQVIPVALGVTIFFLMILVGLAFASPPSGPRKNTPTRTRPRGSKPNQGRSYKEPVRWSPEPDTAIRRRR
ncbi:hypothetical protein GCM10009069_27880 [Algimonas arctica]|uniref:Cellulose synthase regulatory subunit n=1 Tax=Algimonas arctica TaxID=1479486 RepID=A0A8J3G3P2_9PROT|nr:hypothetical protein [Algimonas arctica]GHB03656.1 hypothetical protein GCM10009069_27880 [Algimonas arctica]